jgi:hypothetical protein
VARGEHADAVAWFTRGLELTSESNSSVRLHVARARARQHLGSLRDAVDDYTAALELLQSNEGGSVAVIKEDDGEVLDVSGATLARGGAVQVERS